MKNCDLCIIGGGLVGLTLAVALKPLGLNIIIIDAKDPKNIPDMPDTRTLALSWSSIQFLDALGLWSNLKPKACPIDQVHISEKGSCSIARLTKEEAGVQSLGHVIPITHLYADILTAAQSAATIISPEHVKNIDANKAEITCESGLVIQAKLIIGADGARSFCKEHLGLKSDHIDYKQTAIVTSVTLKNPHQNIAYERFLSNGILALLPLTQNRYGVVWTQSTQESEASFALSDEALLQDIQTQFGYRVGKMQSLGPKSHYPLHQILASQSHTGKVLLLGNAAHNLNPVAAQGFNLCVNDIQALTTLIQNNPLDEKLFAQYDALTKPTHDSIIKTTNLIAKTYASDNAFVKLGRRLAVTGINRCAITKKAFTELMMGKTKSGEAA